MELIKIKNSDLEISRVIYGCMRIGGQWDAENYEDEHKNYIFKLLDNVIEKGINIFDHADIYSMGKSEKIFGEYIKERSIKRENIIIQTKCGIRRKDDPEYGIVGRYDFSYEHIVNSVENSLKRLQTDYIDILLLHRPDILCEPEEVAKAFEKLKNDGKVKYFGVSNHSPFQLELLQKYTDEKLLFNQIEINLQNYGVFEEEVTFNNLNFKPFNAQNILNYSRINDITIQAWSPLGKGFINNTENYELREYLKFLAMKYETTIEGIQILFLLTHPAKILPVLGSINLERLNSMIDVVGKKLTREEWYKILVLARGNALP
ncbi:MAG TPA: aldo/keto reductase [Ignavibacteriales bacterium]|nr:aldo/keto reductase [Ignavibacteriales bacterium]